MFHSFKNTVYCSAEKLACLFAIYMSFFVVPAMAQSFELPIAGVPYKDWTIINYVDLDTGPGIVDWKGGRYTYDGHRGIDFSLANFAKMDEGVEVYAAADGHVFGVIDGHFDRWSLANPGSRTTVGNEVQILHHSGYSTSYLHLKKDSIVVENGDYVLAGDLLGLVGSSGFSDGPHLHFGVRSNEVARIATYTDASYWWKEPLDYPSANPGILDVGITASNPSAEQIQQRPVEQRNFSKDVQENISVYFWWVLFGTSRTDVITYDVITPNGTIFESKATSIPPFKSAWQKRVIELPANAGAGIWVVEAKLNDEPLFLEKFELSVNDVLDIENTPSDSAPYNEGFVNDEVSSEIITTESSELSQIAIVNTGALGFLEFLAILFVGCRWFSFTYPCKGTVSMA